jgi:hypothetical protein
LAANISLSKTWNVAKLTSAISSSPKVRRWDGTVLFGAMSATEFSADAAKDIPAIPRTDMALVEYFFFEGRFAWYIADYLLKILLARLEKKLALRRLFSAFHSPRIGGISTFFRAG